MLGFGRRSRSGGVRRASHAGSWYSDDGQELEAELERWIRDSKAEPNARVRGVIAPHAGFRYSGRCAAFAFAHIDTSSVSRIFLLGPSHHHYSHKCLLTRNSVYETPVGNISIDTQVVDELRSTGEFDDMAADVDEAEHSLEMHLPYLALVFRGKPVALVPIMVGALHAEAEERYGQLLAKYIDDPSNFFAISSDFCHWGSRFNYTPHNQRDGQIYQHIEKLDKQGMALIEKKDFKGFTAYLRDTRNTICGRHPIGVFLNVIKNSKTSFDVQFVQYEQSSKCVHTRDSSVSYASAIAVADESN